MERYGATEDDFAQVKAKNSRHGAHQPQRPLPQGVQRGRRAGLARSWPIRCTLLDICATSDGGRRHRALVAWSSPGPRAADPVRVAAISTVTPTYPADGASRCPTSPPTRPPRLAPPDLPFRDSIAARRLRGGRASAPTTSTWPRSTTCRRPSSSTGTRTSGSAAEGEAEQLLRDGDTEIGGRIPVNPSGGLACFGEAIPAQAIAQVCELTWQLRGQAGDRQVEGAKVGLTVNQGLFGHGSSVIVTR